MNTWVRLAAVGALATGCALFHGCASDSAVETATLEPIILVEEETVVLQPEEPVVAPQPELLSYTIIKGDTLSQIARDSGVRLPDILALNPNVKPNRIRVGQKIQLPATARMDWADKPRAEIKALAAGEPVVYTVVKGDSLSVIAYRFGIKTQALREANELKSDLIRVGQKLAIPAPTKAYPPEEVAAQPEEAPAIVE